MDDATSFYILFSILWSFAADLCHHGLPADTYALGALGQAAGDPVLCNLPGGSADRFLGF